MTRTRFVKIITAHAAYILGKPEGKKADFSNVYFNEWDLTGVNLPGADFTGANLEAANLPGANLRGANLRGANLEAANLRGANLEGADLYGANLRGANLVGARLYGAKLEGALRDPADPPIPYWFLTDGRLHLRTMDDPAWGWAKADETPAPVVTPAPETARTTSAASDLRARFDEFAASLGVEIVSLRVKTTVDL